MKGRIFPSYPSIWYPIYERTTDNMVTKSKYLITCLYFESMKWKYEKRCDVRITEAILQPWGNICAAKKSKLHMRN